MTEPTTNELDTIVGDVMSRFRSDRRSRDAIISGYSRGGMVLVYELFGPQIIDNYDLSCGVYEQRWKDDNHDPQSQFAPKNLATHILQRVVNQIDV